MALTLLVEGDPIAGSAWDLELVFRDSNTNHKVREFKTTFGSARTEEVLELGPGVRGRAEPSLLIHASITKMNQRSSFNLSGVGLHDAIFAAFVAKGMFLVKIFHSERSAYRPCVVECANGLKAEKCIACESENVYVKVCC